MTSPPYEVKIAAPFTVSEFDVTFNEWDQRTATGARPQGLGQRMGDAAIGR
jgi:hypothetical protein